MTAGTPQLELRRALSDAGDVTAPRLASDERSARPERATLWRSRVLPLACRVVGSTRRRPLRLFVLWFAATWLPFDLANVVQGGMPLLLLAAWLIAGRARDRQAVEAVTALWARRRGEVYRPGWFGRGRVRSTSRGSL